MSTTVSLLIALFFFGPPSPEDIYERVSPHVRRIYSDDGHCTAFVVEHWLVSATHCAELFGQKANYSVLDMSRIKWVERRGLKLRRTPLRPGETVYVVGYPTKAKLPKMVMGLVAGPEESGTTWYTTMTAPGFSGGALVDKDGKVIAIHSGSLTDDLRRKFMGYSEAQAIMWELLK